MINVSVENNPSLQSATEALYHAARILYPFAYKVLRNCSILSLLILCWLKLKA